MTSRADRSLLLTTAAYHETGHAVMAYCFGWWVNYHGVEIEGYGKSEQEWLGQRDYCGLRHTNRTDSVEANVCVNCAGRVSDAKAVQVDGYGQRRDDVLTCLEFFR